MPQAAAGGTLAHPMLITPAMLRSWPLPEPTGSKYRRGQVLVVGGARFTPGAAMLAGLAGLRVGAGRLSLGVAESVAGRVAVAIPESGAFGLAEDDEGSVSGEAVAQVLGKEIGRTDALLVGPGLDEPEGTIRLLTEILAELPSEVPVVLDAFGATVLPDLDPALLKQLSGRLVLTPNAGELARLLELDELDEEDVAQASLDCAKRYGAAVGCNSWVVHEGRVWQVTTGDTGLGTSGSGDVVAGAVAGLLSRGASLPQALGWGKYVHAAAGDALVARFGRVGYLAGELLPELPRVLSSLGGD
ncbi:NAD(P)H-hydrate dehydratase [Luteococcus peritonei]